MDSTPYLQAGRARGHAIFDLHVVSSRHEAKLGITPPTRSDCREDARVPTDTHVTNWRTAATTGNNRDFVLNSRLAV